MLRMMKVPVFLGIAGLAVVVMAQENDQSRNKAANQPRANANRDGANRDGANRGEARLEGHLADCLLLKNEEEIALARFALDKTKNAEVKKFAQMLIDDHQQFVTELRQFAAHSDPIQLRVPRTGEQNDATRTREGDNRDANRKDAPKAATETATDSDKAAAVTEREDRDADNAERNASGRRGAGQGRENIDSKIFVIQHREVQECLSMVEDCLSKKEGAEFDKAFVGMQIGAHMAMLAKMKAIEGEVSSGLQQLISKGEKTVKMHKEKAEELIHSLDSASTRQAGRENSATRKE